MTPEVWIVNVHIITRRVHFDLLTAIASLTVVACKEIKGIALILHTARLMQMPSGAIKVPLITLLAERLSAGLAERILPSTWRGWRSAGLWLLRRLRLRS